MSDEKVQEALVRRKLYTSPDCPPLHSEDHPYSHQPEPGAWYMDWPKHDYDLELLADAYVAEHRDRPFGHGRANSCIFPFD